MREHQSGKNNRTPNRKPDRLRATGKHDGQAADDGQLHRPGGRALGRTNQLAPARAEHQQSES